LQLDRLRSQLERLDARLSSALASIHAQRARAERAQLCSDQPVARPVRSARWSLFAIPWRRARELAYVLQAARRRNPRPSLEAASHIAGSGNLRERTAARAELRVLSFLRARGCS